MDTKQIDRDLAEKVCGFVWKSDTAGAWRLKFSPSISRDDAHEVLAKLTNGQRQSVVAQLRNMLCEDVPIGGWQSFWLILAATPGQISEAVWRATCQ
tara:strand:+ start:713 stop:1003 length:291 start_codon:yes stop_codon:yes gene_type:complete